MTENVGQGPRRVWSVEIVAAAGFGILAVACFVWQGMTIGAHLTATETFLFHGLQFLLTSGFAWFSTRAVSRTEFEGSLKRFAISAHRRIADIERMVDHLHQEVREMILQSPRSECATLRIIEAIVSDTTQLVRSSRSDWGDVIGDELLAIEKIKRLEQEKERLRGDESSQEPREPVDALKKIEDRIATILETLPPRLQLEAESERVPAPATRRAANWLAAAHHESDGLEMTVVTGDRYLHERDTRTLTPAEPLLTDKDENGGIDVRDENGLGIGRLMNLTPLTYGNFAKGFELCYGSAQVSLEFVRVSGVRTDEDGTYAWIRVRVKTQPVLPPRRRRAAPPTTS